MTVPMFRAVRALVAGAAALVAAALPAHADDIDVTALRNAIADLRTFPAEAAAAARTGRTVDWGPYALRHSCGYNCFIFCFNTANLEYSTTYLAGAAKRDVHYNLDLMAELATATNVHFDTVRTWIKVDVMALRQDLDQLTPVIQKGAQMIANGDRVNGKRVMLLAIDSLNDRIARHQQNIQSSISRTGRYSAAIAQRISDLRTATDRLAGGDHWHEENTRIIRYAEGQPCGSDAVDDFVNGVHRNLRAAGKKTVDLVIGLEDRAKAADRANSQLTGVLNDMQSGYRDLSEKLRAVPPNDSSLPSLAQIIVKVKLAVARRQMESLVTLSQSLD